MRIEKRIQKLLQLRSKFFFHFEIRSREAVSQDQTIFGQVVNLTEFDASAKILLSNFI